MSDTQHDNGIDTPDSAPTRVLAPTGTPEFADACEAAAVAIQDMHERDQAMETLLIPAATTAMLTEATRSGGTQELPAAIRAAVQDAGTPASDGQRAGDDAAASPVPSRRRAAVVAGGLVAVVLIAIAAWWGISHLSQVSVTAVQQILEADAEFMAGFAADDYVEATPYRLSDVQIVSSQEDDDGSTLVDVTAHLENESFSSEATATLKVARSSDKTRYSELKNAPATDSGWSGVVVTSSATTRAIAGVTEDPDFPQGFDPSFDATDQRCTYTAERAFDLWFGVSTVSTPYTYAFDGTTWVRSEGDAELATSYDVDRFQGTYGPQDGDLSQIVSFNVLGFDATSGSFAIEYRASTPGFGSSPVSGTLQCTLTAAEPTDATAAYRQVDGLAYTFSGTGTSSGGTGSASIEGALGLDGSLVVSMSIDYTEPPFLFGLSSDETMQISGTLVRADA